MLSSTDMDRRVAVPHNTEGFGDMFLHSFLEFSGFTNMGAGEVTSFFFAGVSAMLWENYLGSIGGYKNIRRSFLDTKEQD